MTDGACLHIIDVHTRAAVFATHHATIPWPFLGILVRADGKTEHVYFSSMQGIVDFIRYMTPDKVKVSCAAEEDKDELARLVTGVTTLQ